MPSTGDMLHQYKILRPLGKGGMGEVFLAQDTLLGRSVALKFLHESSQQDPEARKRFLLEARAAAALDHPLICRVHEAGEVESEAFIAMEYVAGETLGERLARGPLPLNEALQMASDVAEALGEAHEKGIVHRDLKPSNIMLTPQGRAKIMDFGLARRFRCANDAPSQESTDTALTQAGTVVGTIAYMSPEQARGEQADARSDIFLFGVVLYETLAGVHPFRRPSQVETLSAILRDDPPPLSVEVPAALPSLRSILSKATAKDPVARYQTTKDLADDLDKLRHQLSVQRRPAWIIRVLSAAGILVAALLAWIFWLAHRAPPSAPAAALPPVSVLIADFQNHTGDPVFDGTLEPGFAIALEGAPFITSYDRKEGHRIGKQLQPGATSLDRMVAQLVAKRQGINVVLGGTIDRQGEGYRVSVDAIDAASGKSIVGSEADAANKQDVLAVVGKLAAPVRKTLGDATPVSVQLAAEETYTAGSLEAAHHYAIAQEFLWAGKEEEAVRHYSLAIQLDPDFGRAYAGLAAIYSNRSQLSEGEKYYQMAMARIDRMSEREKYRTRGGYYLMKRNYPKAIEELSALVRQYPADTSAINNLALANFYAHDMSRALQECHRAVAQYPRNLLYRSNLALFAMYAADFEKAASESRAVLDQNPDYEVAYVALALSELARGRADQAAEVYKRLEVVSASGASRAALGLADIALYEGRSAVAVEILEKGIAGDRANSNTSAAAVKHIALAQSYLMLGKTRLAIDSADRAVAADKQVSVEVAAARIYVEAGQERKALAIASDLVERLEPDPQSYGRLIQGEAHLKAGNTRKAVKLFEEAKKMADTWIGRLNLGRAYLHAGAFTEADSELEACLNRRGEATAVFLDDMPTYRYLPPVYYYLGRAREGLKSPAAAESYRTFLAIREKGEPDPLLADARRRLGSRSERANVE